MKYSLLILIFTAHLLTAQQPTVELKTGDKAPGFVLTQQMGAVQGYSMPYLNRIVLLHFWSSTVKKSRNSHHQLARFYSKYKNALYRSVDGFEIITVAVQSDKNAWSEALTEDSMAAFVNGIASRGYNDEICKKYGVNQLPADVLMDETGTIIAINPGLRELEYILDERKNFQVIRKNITGTFAETDNSTAFLRGGNLYLFNNYGDTIAKTTISPAGVFTINDLKLNQDFNIRVQTDLNPSQNMDFSIYTARGEKAFTSSPQNGELLFKVPASGMEKLIEDEDGTSAGGGIDQIEVIKSLLFKPNGQGLLPKDEKELEPIVSMMLKNKALIADISTHVNSKVNSAQATGITKNQAQSIRAFLISKGIASGRIITSFKGQTQPREKCAPCTEEQLKKNSRVEFRLYKN